MEELPQILYFTVRKVTANDMCDMMPGEVVLKSSTILRHIASQFLIKLQINDSTKVRIVERRFLHMATNCGYIYTF